MKKRSATFQRKTKEVQIRGMLNLDGSGKFSISTGIPFLDHMLELFTKHGLFDLTLKARGDLEVDLHHTNEDIGLSLGAAFRKALGDKKGIRRVGFEAYVPMDETLARVVVDFSGRPYFEWGWKAGKKEEPRSASYSIEDAKHFLQSFAAEGKMTLHVDLLKAGGDTHHILEAVFKALGRAMLQAVEHDPRVKGVPSTKGKL